MKGNLRLALPGSNAHSVFECLSSLLGDSPGISAGGRRCRGGPPLRGGISLIPATSGVLSKPSESLSRDRSVGVVA